MPRSSKFNRLVVAGIAAAAISPTAALASPAIDGWHARAADAGHARTRPGRGPVVAPRAGRDRVRPHQPIGPATDHQARRSLTATASTAASWSPSAAAHCCSSAASASRAASACSSCASASRPDQRTPGDAATGGVPGTRRRA